MLFLVHADLAHIISAMYKRAVKSPASPQRIAALRMVLGKTILTSYDDPSS